MFERFESIAAKSRVAKGKETWHISRVNGLYESEARSWLHAGKTESYSMLFHS